MTKKATTTAPKKATTTAPKKATTTAPKKATTTAPKKATTTAPKNAHKDVVESAPVMGKNITVVGDLPENVEKLLLAKVQKFLQKNPDVAHTRIGGTFDGLHVEASLTSEPSRIVVTVHSCTVLMPIPIL